MNEEELPEFPKSPIAGSVFEAVKIGANMLPIVGGAGAELLGAVFGPQLEKQKIVWFGLVRDAIITLQQQVDGLTLDVLAQNESFFATAMYATQIAVRTTQKEKLKALRNAILNAALPNASEGNLQHLYLNLIDVLTVCEMKLLTLYLEPQRFGIADIQALSLPIGTIREKILEKVLCLGGDEHLYSFCVNDLVNRGLLSWGSRRGTVGPSGDYAELYAPNVTAIGGGFFKFIHDPFTEQIFEDEMS